MRHVGPHMPRVERNERSDYEGAEGGKGAREPASSGSSQPSQRRGSDEGRGRTATAILIVTRNLEVAGSTSDEATGVLTWLLRTCPTAHSDCSKLGDEKYVTGKYPSWRIITIGHGPARSRTTFTRDEIVREARSGRAFACFSLGRVRPAFYVCRARRYTAKYGAATRNAHVFLAANRLAGGLRERASTTSRGIVGGSSRSGGGRLEARDIALCVFPSCALSLVSLRSVRQEFSCRVERVYCSPCIIFRSAYVNDAVSIAGHRSWRQI